MVPVLTKSLFTCNFLLVISAPPRNLGTHLPYHVPLRGVSVITKWRLHYIGLQVRANVPLRPGLTVLIHEMVKPTDTLP